MFPFVDYRLIIHDVPGLGRRVLRIENMHDGRVEPCLVDEREGDGGEVIETTCRLLDWYLFVECPVLGQGKRWRLQAARHVMLRKRRITLYASHDMPQVVFLQFSRRTWWRLRLAFLRAQCYKRG